MKKEDSEVNEDENCLICGKEIFPVDEFGSRACDCTSLETALSKAFQ